MPAQRQRLVIEILLVLISLTIGIALGYNRGTAITTTTTTQAWKSEFVAQYETVHSALDYDSSQALLVKAQILCLYLDFVSSLEKAHILGLALDMSSDQTITVIEAGIATLCTEHEPLLV